ncbi:hypothetical protein [Agrobacterium rosae]|uniref:hypothetical protein n=1 Tax=Agrobacterium rosae TaxID=1972867 RepID=UPI00122F40FF|nr:hypothetical protein [Agrobacterium rosae]KAA3510121.1 hypothetical protein DXM21_20035 [Agrobacterium rosae]KAA3514934.1 hypothetical protein DXM25_20335 [Agrobacterium rosae]MQB50742.1 hypothetical protein [Agrobacterium rosae]
MTEDEERETNPAYLKQRVDLLEWLVSILIGTLSENQRGYLEERLATRTRFAEEDVQRRDTDPARDERAIIYDLDQNVSSMSEDSAEGYAIYLEER